ncbi:MAG: diguanylate cyclase [Aquihabitans sp.]
MGLKPADGPTQQPGHDEVFRRAPVCLALVEATTGTILAVNDILAERLGSSPDLLVGLTWPTPLGGSRTDFADLVARVPAQGSVTVDMRMGEGIDPVWWRQQLTGVVPATGVPYLIIQVDDRTAEHQRTSALEKLADHDELTGAWNRRRFRREFRRALDPMAVGYVGLVLFDVDGFKLVNDSHGHAAGDTALVAVTSTLRSVAPPDALVARLAGDEFAVLISGPRESEVASRCAQLAEAAHRVPVADSLAEVTLSAGWSITAPGPDPERRANHAFIEADVAMYATKARSRSAAGLGFGPADDEEPVARSWLTDDGSAQDVADFELWSHPIVSVSDGAQVMHDVALHAPDTDPSRADQPGIGFITLGALVEILDRVHRDTRRHIGSPERYLVHLPDFPLVVGSAVDWIRRAADDAGLNPGAVTFALGESRLLEAGRWAYQVLGGLREAGFGVAIDQFGAETASMGLLGDLPHDQLWLQPRLIEDAAKGGFARSLIEATVYLARATGATVGAAGATVDLLPLLTSLGIHHALLPDRDKLRPIGGIGRA